MKKISTRWTTRKLTPLDKQRRLESCKDFFGVDLVEISNRIETVDETWNHKYDPVTKQESMQWMKKADAKGERKTKNVNVEKSTREYY